MLNPASLTAVIKRGVVITPHHADSYFNSSVNHVQSDASKVFPRFQPIFISFTKVNASVSGTSFASIVISGTSYLLSALVGSGVGVWVTSASLVASGVTSALVASGALVVSTDVIIDVTS